MHVINWQKYKIRKKCSNYMDKKIREGREREEIRKSLVNYHMTDSDRNDGQSFKAMEWWWVFFSNDGMAMVFENSHHHHWWNGTCSTIGSDGFSMVFPILRTNGSRWLRDKMRVNEDLSETKHGMKSTSTQVDINQGTSCSRHCKKIFLIFQKLSLVCSISASARHKGRNFTTIAKNQWFLR